VLVAGSGHGGTTILSMILGQHAAIFATGKLRDFPSGGLFGDVNVCSCGSQALACEFWAQVRDQFAPWQDSQDPARYTELFRIISTLSGRPFVGDVSHNVDYAQLLQQLPDIDLYLVHVVRDGRGVVNSRIRKDYKIGELEKRGWRHFRRVIMVSRRWAWHARQFASLEKKLGSRAVRIDYEAMCRDPLSALCPVGECLGLDFDRIGELLGSSQPFEPLPHLIRGNAVLRSKTDVVLRHDASYLTEMSLFDRGTFQVASRLT
jgi:hypothetical protein